MKLFAAEEQELYGPYTCHLEIMDEVVYNHNVSANTVVTYQGNNVTYVCAVVAYPPVSVSNIRWERNNTPIELNSEGIPTDPKIADRFQFKNTSAPFDTMIISQVTMSDRVLYSCFAANNMGNDTSAFFLRVKGK
ncbi:hypothetical protein Ciccas_008680 [Cichlidogyrus casuarinus]|uniref:Ig-like domain-containing protein n=1 Tax=Cichlidogyrus casuarinus TaxID=1844966 RepID=A0ABD2PZ81_9PLAT